MDIKSTNIILYCKRWAETVAFYRNGLGLKVLLEKDWFVEFAVTAGSRLSVADERRASIDSSDGQGITIALEVEDIDATWSGLDHARLQPTPVREHPWGARVFYMNDPEGNRIELWSPEVES